MDMLRLGQIGHRGAEGLEGAARGLQVRAIGELAGVGRERPPGGGGEASEIGPVRLAQGRQGLLVADEVVGGECRLWSAAAKTRVRSRP